MEAARQGASARRVREVAGAFYLHPEDEAVGGPGRRCFWFV